MANAKLEFGDDGYRIVVGEEESDVVDYGESLEFKSGGRTYASHVDKDDQGEVFSHFSEWVLCGEFVEVELEDVEFEEDEGDGDEEDEEEEDEEEGEEEEVPVPKAS